MLSQLYETAIKAQQDKEDAAANHTKKLFEEAKATHIPLIKAALTKAAENGELFTSYAFPGYCFTSSVQADISRLLNEWYAEEPEWDIPFGFVKPEPTKPQDYPRSEPNTVAIGLDAGERSSIAIGHKPGSNYSDKTYNVWFDFREPNKYVLK